METNPYQIELIHFLQDMPELEIQLDGLRRFKREQSNQLQKQFLDGKLGLNDLMEKLSDLADAILIQTFHMAEKELPAQLGRPRFQEPEGMTGHGAFALIGMGKLGARELHFGSDLDVIFVFNRNGQTDGEKVITNQEYFSRVAQRIISYLTLYTRERYAYSVDTELRPSGKAGALVTALEPWIRYYHEHAQLWEKQALLKARLIFANQNFAEKFSGLFEKLILAAPFPTDMGQEIHRLRTRIEKELAKESARRWHYKKGYGGLLEIEFTVQYLQLQHLKALPSLLEPHTLTALDLLKDHDMLSQKDWELLKKAYEFYRCLEIHLELEFESKEGYLDPEQDYVEELASRLAYSNAKEFLKTFTEFRKSVREIYQRILKITTESI